MRDGDQHFDAACLEGGDRRAAGVTGIVEDGVGRPQRIAALDDGRFERRCIARCLRDIRRPYPLAAIGVDHGLRIVGLAELVARRFAHRLAIRVGEVDLTRRWRRIVGRLGSTAIAGFPSFDFLVISGPLFLRLDPGIRLQAGASLVQLRLQHVAPGDLGRQGLGVFGVLDLGRLRPRRQRGDVLSRNAFARSSRSDLIFDALASILVPSMLTVPSVNSFNSLAISKTCAKAARFSRRKGAMVS